jgi:hypothetical protein
MGVRATRTQGRVGPTVAELSSPDFVSSKFDGVEPVTGSIRKLWIAFLVAGLLLMIVGFSLYHSGTESESPAPPAGDFVSFLGYLMLMGGAPGIFIYARRNEPARLKVAKTLWFLGGFGIFGWHHFYLKRSDKGVLYIFTAGLFFVGAIGDFMKMPQLVLEANTTPEERETARRLWLESMTPEERQAYFEMEKRKQIRNERIQQAVAAGIAAGVVMSFMRRRD